MAYWIFTFMFVGFILSYVSSEANATVMYDMCVNRAISVNDDRITLRASRPICNSTCILETTSATTNVTFSDYEIKNNSPSQCTPEWNDVIVKVKTGPGTSFTRLTTKTNVSFENASTLHIEVAITADCISYVTVKVQTDENQKFSNLTCYNVSRMNLSSTSSIVTTTISRMNLSSTSSIVTTTISRMNLSSTSSAVTTTIATATTTPTTVEAQLSSHEHGNPWVLSSSTQSQTESYPVSDTANNKNPTNIGLIIGIVVGVGGGIVIIIAAVLIGITIRRRHAGKINRFVSLSVTAQNQNSENENSFGNPMIQSDDSFDKRTISAQQHLVDPHKDPAKDGTYIGLTTMTHDADEGSNFEKRKNSEFNPADPESNIVQVKIDNYDNFTPVENDTILVENDLYASETNNAFLGNGSSENKNNMSLGNDNNPNPADNNLSEEDDDTTLVENDMYGK